MGCQYIQIDCYSGYCLRKKPRDGVDNENPRGGTSSGREALILTTGNAVNISESNYT